MNQDSRRTQEEAGLCGRCRFRRLIENDRGSLFFLCAKSFEDPRFPKYPRLPVRSCDGYLPVEATPAPRG